MVSFHSEAFLLYRSPVPSRGPARTNPLRANCQRSPIYPQQRTIDLRTCQGSVNRKQGVQTEVEQELMLLPFLQLGDFLRCGGQTRTVSPVDVTAVRVSQLTYCVEVAAELLAEVEEQTVRTVHQAQRPGRESPLASYALEGIEAVPVEVVDGDRARVIGPETGRSFSSLDQAAYDPARRKRKRDRGGSGSGTGPLLTIWASRKLA